MKRIILVSFFSFLLSTFSFAYTYLTFSKTQGSSYGWSSGSGTIHNCSIIVSPKGLYSEVSITMELSATGNTNILSGDTLEANFTFDLPQNALVIDSWLWVNDTSKVQADHMGKSTAVSIYNNIVNNIRRDPSLLTKNSYSSDNYNLKIYPFFGLQKRKFRITYLVPIGEDASQYTIDVPLYLLKNTYSYYNQSVTFPDVHLKVYETSTIANPSLSISTTNFSGFKGSGQIKNAT
ncbi:MAG: hypothetical protein K2Q22_12080, partial [Cytophagales bacterium]|nr:hypothetical protein [Cytophagales bacterium]